MLKRALHFIKYNNAFTIGIVIFLFGFGVTFAAGPEVVGAVYSSADTVTSIDNHLILATNLDTFNVRLKIDSVTEDTQNYYVAYSYTTLGIVDGAWQETPVDKTLTVNKDAIQGQDLGTYTAKQLGDNMKYEISYLKRAQTLEKTNGESKKVVTTQYSGLVGKFIDPKAEVVENYSPVVAAAIVASTTIPVPTTNPADANNVRPAVATEDTGVEGGSWNFGASHPLNELDVQHIIDNYLAEHQSTTDDSSTATTTTVDNGSSGDTSTTTTPVIVTTPPVDTSTTTLPTTTSTTTPPITASTTTPSTPTETTDTPPPPVTPPADAGTTTATSSTP